jgi:hypothetical protein
VVHIGIVTIAGISGKAMKDKFEFEISPDGVIRTMYQEGIEKLAEDMGADIKTSCRASDVEWEDDGIHKGWTVRSAYDRDLAVRWQNYGNMGFEADVSIYGELLFFPTREEALAEEVKHFWKLLEPQRKKNVNE